MGKGFYRNLAAQNLVRNRRFVLPYLLTGILTVAMFYNMAFLTWNDDLANMPGASTLQTIMHLGTIVVGIFAVIFLLYTNSFLTKRRQKEIGLYNILGMEKKHIAKVLLWETLYTCLVTIGLGLLAGILLSKLLLLALYRILFFTVHFGFSVSPVSLGVTAILFAGVYLLALGANLVHVRLSNPVELLRGSNVGEKEPKTKGVLTAVGLVTLGIGYYIALTTESPLEALILFFLAVILVIVGTYCLFTAGSIALLKALKRKKSYYYQPRHFTSVSGMLYRMKQNAVGLASICILSTMVLVMISTSVCLYLGTEDALDNRYPYDVSFSQEIHDAQARPEGEYKQLVLEQAKQAGLTVSDCVDFKSLSFPVVNDGAHFSVAASGSAWNGESGYGEILTAEGYAQLTGRQVTLEKDQVVAYCNDRKEDWATLSIGGSTFRVAQWQSDFSGTDRLMEHVTSLLCLVVADDGVLEQLYEEVRQANGTSDGPQWQLSFNLSGTDQEIRDCYERMTKAVSVPRTTVNYDEDGNPAESVYYAVSSSCRQEATADFYAMYGGLLFLGLFLGALFLLATVLIIYYKQISEGYDDKERFAILEKVGMSHEEIKASIRSQILVVFFLPLAAAVLHLAVSFKMITKLMVALNLTNVPLFALCALGTALVFAAAYLVIYALTARTYYKIVR